MLITNKFVFVHLRKTGGTHIRTILIEIHQKIFKDTLFAYFIRRLGRFIPAMKQIKATRIFVAQYNYDDLTSINPQSITNYYRFFRPLNSWIIKVAARLGLLGRNVPNKTLRYFTGHARYAQLNDSFHQLPVVACIRDPFTWHVSRYNYDLQQYDQKNMHHKEGVFAIIDKRASYEEYCFTYMIKLQNMNYQGYRIYMRDSDVDGEWRLPRKDNFYDICKPDSDDLYTPISHYGFMTFNFICSFFKRPLEVLRLPPGEFEEYFISGAYKNNMPNIHFLETENLNQELYDFLLSYNYKKEHIEHIKKSAPIAPENISVAGKHASFYKSKAQVNYIYKLERAMFIMFPQYEDKYKHFLPNA